jgi:hypothetical protein
MAKGLSVLVALTCLGTVAGAAAADVPSLVPCSGARTYFEGSYYRAVKLTGARPAVGKRAGAGTYVPCNGTAPGTTPLRRIPGVRAGVALRDAEYPHLLYVAGTLCNGRGGRALLRCLHRATPRDLIVPPPAFAIAGDRYTPLGYTSACWFILNGSLLRGSCVDYVWPPSSPSVVSVEPGGTLTFQLGFRTDYLALFVYGTGTDYETIVLPASEVTSWHVPDDVALPALFELRAHGATGEGGYVGRLVDASAAASG